MDDFIETGSGGGIGFGLCKDIEHPVIDEEKIISLRRYHTITESKNGAGATPIRTDKGWIHIAHGVRNTAAGLRYVLYAFMTALDDPSRVIAEPSGMLLWPDGARARGRREQRCVSPTARLRMTTARCTSTMLRRTRACTSPKRTLTACATICCTRPKIRCVRRTACASAACSSRTISRLWERRTTNGD